MFLLWPVARQPRATIMTSIGLMTTLVTSEHCDSGADNDCANWYHSTGCNRAAKRWQRDD